MPRIKRTLLPTTARQRLICALSAGAILAALPVTAPSPANGPWTVAAYAQQADRATQVLFLAVDKNDLPGVQAAINEGADITARDFNGMQAVDLAIERGYFDIAHYLISVRNQLEAQGKTAAPAPTPKQLAADQQFGQAPQTAEPVTPPAPELPSSPPPGTPPGAPSPFDAPRAGEGLPVIGEVREPAQAPEPTEVAQTDSLAGAPAVEPAKPSAVKSFITTFTDFFRPPNTTGIVRKDTPVGANGQDALTDEELQQQLEQLEAELGNAPIKGPAVPISPDELARELPPSPELPDDVTADAPLDTPALPPYRVTSPGDPAPQRPAVSGQEAFGDLAIADVTAADEQPLAGGAPLQSGEAPLDPNLPFGGRADPDIMAFLGMGPAGDAAPPTQVAEADPFAQPGDPFASPAQDGPADPFADPFATPSEDGSQDGPESVADVLQGLEIPSSDPPPLDAPQEITELQTRKPTLPEGAQDAEALGGETPIDPFATPPGDVDELAGLFEGIGESVASKQDGWDVKEVEGATLPSEMPVLTDVEPTGQPLDGVELTLGADAVVGQAVGEDRLKMMDEETIHKPCLQKGGPETVFCVDKVSWPFDLEEDFLVDTIMYQGTRTIARYDAGRASHFHALFNTGAFTKVVNYYIGRFGQPSEKVERAIAPLAQPRRDNPTYIWRSREPGTDTITTLEIRQFDDARGGFPDTRRGVILLYRDHAGEIFPLLSQLELMVLKDSGAMDLAPATPESVW